MFFVQEGFTYRNFLMDMVAVFAFVVWFWLLVVIYGDLFRRHDIAEWGKALWVLALVLTSYLGILPTYSPKGEVWPSVALSRPNKHATNCDISLALASQTKIPSLII